MKTAYAAYQSELDAIRQAGLYKDERIITTPQSSRIDTTQAKGVVNLCANNYLGLSDHPRLIAAAKEAAALCALPHLEWEGVFTHFANADGDEDYTMLQFTRFLDALEEMEKVYGLTFEIRHCAASAAVLNYPCTHMDMIRPGVSLYG